MGFRAHKRSAPFVAHDNAERFVESNDRSFSMLADPEGLATNGADLCIGSENHRTRRSNFILHVTESSNRFRGLQRIYGQDEEVQSPGKELGRFVSRAVDDNSR